MRLGVETLPSMCQKVVVFQGHIQAVADGLSNNANGTDKE